MCIKSCSISFSHLAPSSISPPPPPPSSSFFQQAELLSGQTELCEVCEKAEEREKELRELKTSEQRLRGRAQQVRPWGLPLRLMCVEYIPATV